MFKMIKNKRRKPFTIHHSPLTHKGQVILEFTFCMIVILIMIYGVIKVFHWAGMDLVERQRAHEAILIRESIITDPCGIIIFGICFPVTFDDSPRQQINPDFYAPVRMNTIWDGN